MNGKLLLFQNNIPTGNQTVVSLKSVRLRIDKLIILFGILSISLVGFSQTGPVGINNGIDLWLDASDLDADGAVEGFSENNLSGGNDVEQWRDKSGQNNHVQAPGSTFDPLYIDSDPDFNNRAVVDFDVGEYLWVNCGDWDDTHTIFIVFRQQGTPAANAALLTTGLGSSSGVDNIIQIGVDTAATHIAYQTESTGTITQSLFGTTAAAATGPTLVTATRELPDLITTYDNGLPSATLNSTTGQSIHRYYLNADKTTTSTNDCQVAEIIVYDRVLSAIEISRIHAYLSCKYNADFGGATPGGIDPCDVSLWMKADVGVGYSSGTDVDAWQDQSSSNIDGTAASGEEPTLDSVANNFNPAISFDPTTSDAIDLGMAVSGDGLMIGSDTFSIYSVAMPDTVTLPSGVLFSDNLCVAQPGYTVSYESASNQWKFFGGNASYADSVSVFANNASGGYSLLKVNRITQNYTAAIQIGAAGTNNSAATINYSSAGATQRWIGKESACGSNNFNGQISELIVVRNNLTALEDIQLQSYLGLKYGITIPSTFTTYLASDGATVIWNDGTYWNDVAGIGKDNGSMLDQRISKAQSKSAIVTMATDNNFATTNLDPGRTSLADSAYFIWGHDNGLASDPWTVTGAPTDYAILEEVWRVKETNTVGTIFLQVDVDNPDNDIPGFQGNLHLVHGATIAGGTVVPMTESSTGIWTVPGGIDLPDGDVFTFAVENRLEVEFSALSASSGNEGPTAANFPSVMGSGVINVPTSFVVKDNGNGDASPSGVDYTFSDVTINVAANTYTSFSFPITAPVLNNDVAIEGPEYIEFDFTVGGSVSLGDVDGNTSTYNIHQYTITDDDSYNISIGTPTDGAENGSDATFLVFVEGGPNNTGAAIDGTYTWTGSTATAGTDFTIPSDFSIPDGSSSVTISIPIIDDGLLEGTETIVANITATTPTIGVTTSSATANITDDEVANIGISITSNGDVTEGTAMGFTVAVDGGIINNSGATVDGAIAYGSSAAQNTVDFAGPATFSIPNGQNSVVVTVPTISDFLVENSESVVADISGITIGGISNSSTSSATGLILDEDTTNLLLSISAPSAVEVEGVGNTVTYEVTLSGSKVNGTGGNISGTVALSGAATFPGDYSPNVTAFDIPDGSGVGTIVVSLVDDAISELTEDLVATISSPTLGAIDPAGDNASVNILDDEANNLLISIGSPVNGVEGSSDVTFEVFIASGGTSAVPITGNIDYSSGSAQPVSDFTAVPSFLIPAGGTSTTITLALTDDGATEPVETVVANLTGSPSVGLYANTISTATITDDDAANLEIFIDTINSGAEGGSDIALRVHLDLGATNGTGSDIYGTISLSGTALSTVDYVESSTVNWTILPNEDADTVYLTVVDDFAVEYTDTVIATIISNNVGTISTTNGSCEAYILDNELDNMFLSIQTPTDGEEGVSNASFVVAIDNGWTNELGEPIEGAVSFGGDATTGTDYSTGGGIFSIPVGTSVATLNLIVVDDLSLELTESVIATISAPTHGDINVAAETDTVYIVDNDLINATLIIEEITEAIELPTPAVDGQFRVGIAGGLNNETGTDITGTLSWAGTAIEGTDYAMAATTFLIPNNEGGDTITISIIDDFLAEPTETVIGTITSATLIAIDPIDNDTLNILDNDTDVDNDFLPDLYDPDTNNIDWDCDGIFDGCEADYDDDGILDFPDADGDGIRNGCDADSTGNGVIDNGPDINSDGLNDVAWPTADGDQDLLPAHVDPDDNNPDIDNDTIPDGADVDVNGDGIPDNGCDFDGDGINNTADSDDNPQDGITDVGNLDDDNDGIDNAWDLIDDSAPGRAINYIVSPNGDGVNETLFIQGIQLIDNHVLKIFNRFGEPIYTSTDYNNEWYGQIDQGVTIGSDVVTDGVYFYTLDLGNGEEFVRGYIEIRR